MQAIPRQRAERLLYFFFIAFTLVFINVAWVAEDAFITFRAVDNFLKGYGPVWNVGERVQVYTHPLWYALLIICIGLFKHHYWVTIALSYGCLMATIFLLLKIAKSATSIAQVVIALFVLLLSRAFISHSKTQPKGFCTPACSTASSFSRAPMVFLSSRPHRCGCCGKRNSKADGNARSNLPR